MESISKLREKSPQGTMNDQKIDMNFQKYTPLHAKSEFLSTTHSMNIECYASKFAPHKINDMKE